jgi:pimeloyl-ACP methyl ester carboxylesterase
MRRCCLCSMDSHHRRACTSHSSRASRTNFAPDYPGFGHSDVPARGSFAYTFDHIAEVVGHFTESIGGRLTISMPIVSMS